MNSVKRILSILIICGGAASLLHAQSSATEGKEFYVNFTQNYTYPSTSSGATIQIRYVVSDTCYITTQYGDGTYLDNNVQYLPGTYTKNVDKSKAYTDLSAIVLANDKFLKITSTKNIGVYAINMAAATTDATTVLPIGSLGNHYTVVSNDSYAASYYNNLSIIAPIAGTTITIKDPTGTPIVSNIPVSVGDVYIYPFNSVSDLTGYTVESNVNVCVFVAVGCGTPHPGGGCDFNWEQLWPTNTAGRNYLVWSLSQFNNLNTQATDYIKVIALDSNTTITKNVGGTISTILLNKHQVNAFNTPSAISDNPYANNASSIIKLSSDKPFLVGHILGHAPCIKQISPIEQRVTKAVITPFIPKGTSVITTHKLHILIPASSESNMYVKEVRNGVETDDTLTFYTNTTDTNYKIAYKDFAQYDSVLVYLSNSAGFVAYMAGYGQAESYIITAGAGALDLSAYFTIDGIHYKTIDSTYICYKNNYTLEAFGVTDPNLYVMWMRDGIIVGVGQTYTDVGLVSGLTYSYTMMVMDMYGTFVRTWSCIVSLTPRPNIANKTATICSGSAFSVTLSPNDTTGINPTYAWTVSTPNANIIGATDQTTTQLSIRQTLTNTSNTAQSVVYTVTPTAGNCVGAPFTVTVTVDPKASITAKTATICSGSAFLITPTNGIDGDSIPSGTTYTWTVPNNSVGATNQYSPQTSISQILTNAGSAAQNVTYTVTATSGTCTSTFTITVTVYPFPTLNTDITGPHIVCVGNTIQLSNATAGGAWTVNNSNAAIADPIINPEPVTGIAVGNAYITYTLFYGQCESKKTFLLKVIPATTPNVQIGFEK